MRLCYTVYMNNTTKIYTDRYKYRTQARKDVKNNSKTRIKVKYFNTSTKLYTIYNNTILPLIKSLIAIIAIYIIILLYTV